MRGYPESEKDRAQVTIEFLRGRLVSERGTSKATKSRLSELETEVRMLECKLEDEVARRKKAELATKELLNMLQFNPDFTIQPRRHQVSLVAENGCTSKIASFCVPCKNRAKVNNVGTLFPKSLASRGKNCIFAAPNDGAIASPRSSVSLVSLQRVVEMNSDHEPAKEGSSDTQSAQAHSDHLHRIGRSCRTIKRRDDIA